MADVEIFDYPEGGGGDPLERVIARHVDVQEALQREADGAAAIASGVLAWHRYEGASSVTVTHGDIDWFVGINDHSTEQNDAGAHWVESGTQALGSAFGMTFVKPRGRRRTKKT